MISQEKVKEIIGDLVLANAELRMELQKLREELEQKPARNFTIAQNKPAEATGEKP